MKKGFFITFEGGEGSGKTTLLGNVRKYLESKKYDFIFTREPGGTILGEEIRELVLKQRKEKISSKAELCLFLASRSQHIQEIILPSLKEGKIVLSDRYNDSSLAYQGYARGLGLEEVIQFSFYIIDDAIPDLTIFLDIDPKIGLSRVKGNYDRIESEKIAFHQKIRDGFLILADKFPERIKLIDATMSQEEVFKNTMNYIEKLIK